MYFVINVHRTCEFIALMKRSISRYTSAPISFLNIRRGEFKRSQTD